ncbi:MAG: tandem-95 repeat protein [Planktothrix sp. GU0601_MAG3]|nr:MAG: tandem-95 repeat protein [Planktothrix sp. GU0601_MAG3]
MSDLRQFPQVLIDSNIAFIGGGFTVSGDANNNSGNDAGDVRPFFIKSGTVGFSNLTITGGRAQGGNGSTANSGGGGGAAGMGGALFIYNGSVTIDNVTFTSNQAIGGSSANNGKFLGGGGGFGGNSGGGFGVSGGNGGGGFGGNGGDNFSANNSGSGGSGGAFGGSGGIGGTSASNAGNGTGGGGGGAGWGSTSGGNGAFGGGGGSAGDQAHLNGGWGGFGGGGGAAANLGGRGGFGGGGGVSIHTNNPGAGGFGGGAGGGTTNYSAMLPGGGGAGLGGAIFVREGSLTLQNTTFTNNTTTGGTGANSGKALAGAIFVLDAAAQTAQTTQGNTQGMPAALPTVTALGFLRTSGNTAAQNASTTTDNNDIYGTIINTAPVLADTVVTLNSVLEDAVAPTGAVGTLISAIATIGTNITDPDTGAVPGVAITAADTTNGSWFYTIDGGTTWTALGAVSNTNARLLAANANTRIYFQPTTANYNGTVTNGVTFRAWDQMTGTNGGTANTSTNGSITAFSTATDTAAITVTPVNDQPSFTATNPTAINEDAGAQTVTGWATFTSGPANESAQTATYTVSNIGTPGLFATAPAIDANGNLTYTPAADANGTSTFDVVVQDSGGTANGGLDTSTTQTFTITVNPVNDQPSFTATNPTAINEDAGAQTVTGWATFTSGPANESAQTATYTVSNIGTPGLFATAPAIDANGNLTYTPAADANGTSTFDVVVQDSGGTANGGLDTSTTQTFTITVNPVNDQPSFTATNPTAINEDAGAQTVTGWATFTSGPANESAQTATYTVSNIGTPSLFATAPAIDANGNLTYTPAADANGTSTFDVVVQDSGGTANGGLDTSTTQTFTITVNPVNDQPSFTATNPTAINEDAGAQTVTGWATFTSGPANESAQTATYTVSNIGTPSLFATAPAIDANGNLTYTPAADANGTSTFDVVVQDSGGILLTAVWILLQLKPLLLLLTLLTTSPVHQIMIFSVVMRLTTKSMV